MIYSKLKEKHLQARKDKDTIQTANYGRILSSIDRLRIDVTSDEEVLQQIRKEHKSAISTHDTLVEMSEKVAMTSEQEVKMKVDITNAFKWADELEALLPKQLTEKEVSEKFDFSSIKGYSVKEAKDIVLKHFKEEIENGTLQLSVLMPMIMKSIK